MNNAVTVLSSVLGILDPFINITLIVQLHSKLLVTVRDTSADCNWGTRQLVTPYIAGAINI